MCVFVTADEELVPKSKNPGTFETQNHSPDHVYVPVLKLPKKAK